jgi:hypothetical protein
MKCRFLSILAYTKRAEMALERLKNDESPCFPTFLRCEPFSGHRQIGAIAGRSTVMRRFLRAHARQNLAYAGRGVANARGLAYL